MQSVSKLLTTVMIAALPSLTLGTEIPHPVRPAGLPHRHRPCADCNRCPQCSCTLTIEKEKLTRTCYKIECKPICIPRVTFPWEKRCAPKCARVKMVRVFEPVEKELQCERCLYKWTPECPELPSEASGSESSDE
jgi:hypothetical protein